MNENADWISASINECCLNDEWIPESNIGKVWTPSWTAKTRVPAAASDDHLKPVETGLERPETSDNKKLKVAKANREAMVMMQDMKYIVRRRYFTKSFESNNDAAK